MNALPEDFGECTIPVGGRDAMNLQVSGSRRACPAACHQEVQSGTGNQHQVWVV